MLYYSEIESILAIGSPFPPTSEEARLKQYTQNTQLWDGEHEKVFHALLRLFPSSTPEFDKIVLILGFHKRLSLLWADLLVCEPPSLQTPDDLAVSALVDSTRIWYKAYQTVLDASRYGNGVFEIWIDEEKVPHLQGVNPSKWFPLVDENQRIAAHLIAWVNESYVDHILTKVLMVKIHTRDVVETRKYLVKENKIASPAYDVLSVPNPTGEFLVIPISNLQTTSDTLYGEDDYSSLDSLIKRMEVTLTRIGRILDVHSDPILAIPEGVGRKDQMTGEVAYDSHKRVMELNDATMKPSYIEWGGQLTAAFQYLDWLLNRVYFVSETCPQAFGLDMAGGGRLSGVALRLMMIAPLKRVERFKLSLDPAAKQVIKVLGLCLPTPIDLTNIMINWKDGLPEDKDGEMTLEVNATTNGLSSRSAAMKRLYGFNDDQVKAEFGQMLDEPPAVKGL
jgi:hypothetical protein